MQQRTARLLYNVAALRSGYEIQVPQRPPPRARARGLRVPAFLRRQRAGVRTRKFSSFRGLQTRGVGGFRGSGVSRVRGGRVDGGAARAGWTGRCARGE